MMTLLNAIYPVLGVWIFVANWRKRARDIWVCATGMLFIDATRMIVEPYPTVFSRALAMGAMLVWAATSLHWWDRSGVYCAVYGHEWLIRARTPNGAVIHLTATDDPVREQAMLDAFVPRLLGRQWHDAVIVSLICATCDKERL